MQPMQLRFTVSKRRQQRAQIHSRSESENRPGAKMVGTGDGVGSQTITGASFTIPNENNSVNVSVVVACSSLEIL